MTHVIRLLRIINLNGATSVTPEAEIMSFLVLNVSQSKKHWVWLLPRVILSLLCKQPQLSYPMEVFPMNQCSHGHLEQNLIFWPRNQGLNLDFCLGAERFKSFVGMVDVKHGPAAIKTRVRLHSQNKEVLLSVRQLLLLFTVENKARFLVYF